MNKEHLKNIFAPFKDRNFCLFLFANIVSGAGNSIIPIAFVIESVEIEPAGWGISLVLLFLWAGRFIGMWLYKKFCSAKYPIQTMIISDIFRGFVQFCLLVWIIFGKNHIYAMAISAIFYGFASSFYHPSSFIAIPLLIRENARREANSIISIFGDIYAIIGPLAGASVVIWLGFQAVLFFDCITFLISLLFLVLIQNKNIASNHSVSETVAKNPSVKIESLPKWTIYGLISWFFISLIIGFKGSAAPTLIIGRYSGSSWALIAASIAAGSLLGSAGSLLGSLKKQSWSYLQIFAGYSLGIQLLLISEPFLLRFPFWSLWASGFIASALVSASGIRWDTICQANFSGDRLHRFASLDQAVSTAAIPLGMLLFGVSRIWHQTEAAIYLLATLAGGFTLPLLWYRKHSSLRP